MAMQTINLGAVANDGTGDPLRDAMDKVNDNFTEVYAVTTDAEIAALAALNATPGHVVQTGAGAFTKRTIAGTAPVQVANGSGAAGNPTISVDAATVTAAGIVELATTAEAVTGTDTVRAVTPAGVTEAIGPPTNWTPVLTFATPGDLAVTYSVQVGRYSVSGKKVVAEFVITTSAFTHTTASGNCQITGLPFTAETVTNNVTVGALSWSGITKAGVGQVNASVLTADNKLTLRYSGSGIATGQIAAADMPTAGTVVLRGEITYFRA